MKRESRIVVMNSREGLTCLIVVRNCRLIDWGCCGYNSSCIDEFLDSSVRFETRYYTMCSSNENTSRASSVLSSNYHYIRAKKLECLQLICMLIDSLLSELRALSSSTL